MHFWINKSNQQGHYWPRGYCTLVRPPPEAVTNYLARHQATRSRGFYPKPMVTPVRRFQSIESVANNGLRYSRSPFHHPIRAAVPNTQPVHYNGSTIRIPPIERSQESIQRQTSLQQSYNQFNSRLRCGVVLFTVIVVLVVSGANYFLYGDHVALSVEALVVITVLLVVLLVGGLVFIYEDIWPNPEQSENGRDETLGEHSQQTHSADVIPQSHLPLTHEETSEVPPPPYHIAIMLSPQSESEEVQIVRDQSPPPSYEKAVT